jgi:hypothetical protein
MAIHKLISGKETFFHDFRFIFLQRIYLGLYFIWTMLKNDTVGVVLVKTLELGTIYLNELSGWPQPIRLDNS